MEGPLPAAALDLDTCFEDWIVEMLRIATDLSVTAGSMGRAGLFGASRCSDQHSDLA
jgi:hypothetical protein